MANSLITTFSQLSLELGIPNDFFEDPHLAQHSLLFAPLLGMNL